MGGWEEKHTKRLATVAAEFDVDGIIREAVLPVAFGDVVGEHSADCFMGGWVGGWVEEKEVV